MELNGRIIRRIGDTSGVSASGNSWHKTDLLFGYYERPSDMYEQQFVLSYLNERADQVKDVKEGDQVKVTVRLSCHEWPKGSGRYMNDIRSFDLHVIKPAQEPETPAPEQSTTEDTETPQTPAETPAEPAQTPNDGLPF